MATLINAYRQVLLNGLWPDWQSLVVIVVCSFVGICFARYVLRRFDHDYPKLMMT